MKTDTNTQSIVDRTPPSRFDASTAGGIGRAIRWPFAVFVFVVAAAYLSVAPIGTEIPLVIVPLLIIPFLLSPIAILVHALRAVTAPGKRPQSMFGILSWFAFAALFLLAIRLSDVIRISAYARLVERSVPLVQAIRSFDSTEGRPPASLDELVPQWLPAAPSTGIGAQPEFRYFARGEHFQTDRWMLMIPASEGVLDFSRIDYLPSGAYQRIAPFDSWRLVGDWAYISD